MALDIVSTTCSLYTVCWSRCSGQGTACECGTTPTKHSSHHKPCGRARGTVRLKASNAVRRLALLRGGNVLLSRRTVAQEPLSHPRECSTYYSLSIISATIKVAIVRLHRIDDRVPHLCGAVAQHTLALLGETIGSPRPTVTSAMQ